MKRIKGKTYLSIVERSLSLYLILVATIVGLFGYAYITRGEVLDLYEKAAASHRLSTLAFRLSEENYHTQLEVYEIYSSPTQKRIGDFYYREKLFNERLAEAEAAFASYNAISPAALTKFQALRAAVPKTQADWGRYLEAVTNKKSIHEQRRLLIAAEATFDNENFNVKINEIVEGQLGEVARAEARVRALTIRSNRMVLAGMIFILLLTGMIAILQRSALRGKMHELQLVQAAKLASLGQLSAGVAHEMNNPLMFIKGFNSRIRATLTKANFDSKSDIWNSVAEVDSAVERITKVLSHVRDFARLSKNEMTAVRINSIVTRSFTLIEEQLRLAGVTVDLQLSEASPTIMADANRIEQVFLNLIGNARDALRELQKPAQRKITVKTFVVQDKAIVEFEDSGKGIEKQNLAQIFDPFFTTKSVGQGTGLGLSISAVIIHEHGGKIEAESQPEHGTRFTITLPLYMASA